MLNPNNWGWEQWLLSAMYFMSLGISVMNHGKPKINHDGTPQTYNGFVAAMALAVVLSCLISGGFFK